MTKLETARQVLTQGGYFRKALERNYHGGETFVTRLRNANGQVVRGIGFQTFVKLENELAYRECPSGSTWPSEWQLRQSVAA